MSKLHHPRPHLARRFSLARARAPFTPSTSSELNRSSSPRHTAISACWLTISARR